METVLITGGTGIIGSALIPELIKRGYKVRILSRSAQEIEGVEVFIWDIEWETIEEGAMNNVDHIIHLAGYSVSEGRWTSKRKKLMEDSRIKAVEVLLYHLLDWKIKSFISASGVSIYGTQTSDQIFNEDDSPNLDSNDYLGLLSQDWEKASLQFKDQAERIILMRTPVVLSRSGGALTKIAAPIKKGFGSALGSGKQWMPWVHIDDLVAAYLKAIKDSKMNGTFTVCAEEHVTNKAFTKAIATILGKKTWMPNVPGFVLKLMFGQMANIILKGSRVSGRKIKSRGFNYKYDKLDQALQDLLHD